MRIRPQLIHHWLLILLLAVILMIGHSLGAWAADQTVTSKAVATPTPKAKAKATPTEAATEEASSDTATEGKAAVPQEQVQAAEETKPVDTLEDAPKAVVQIEAVGTFMDPQEGMQMNSAGAGSGFIIDPSGIAVTNNHVATGAAFLKVFVAGEKEPRNARVLGVSECSDLAVIDIEGDGYPYLAWHAGQPTVGLKVYALGFPLGDPEFTMTDGIISKAKASGESSWASVGHVLEHTATINPGNSGGPLVDKDGRVVGINYAGNKDTKQYFAIAGVDAQAVIKELRAGHNVDTVGINGEAISNGKDLAGIWVSSVASGSPADKAGLKAGDIVLTMEGVTLANQGTMTEYCNILRSHKADDVLSMQVLRPSTKEILEGQINGRELAPSVSVANEVQKEEGGDTGANSGGGGSNKDYADYATIATKDNVLSVDVPKEWSDVNEGDWKVDNEVVGTQLAASPDLKKFYDSWGTAGVLISYSQSLAKTKEPQDLLNDIDYSKDCKKHGDQTELPKGYFTGYFESWQDCGNTKTQAVLVALTPTEAHDYVVLIEIYAVTPAELKALDHIIDSFVVRDQNQAANNGNNDETRGSDIKDIVDTSGLKYEYDFVNKEALSALLPQDWTDTATGDWVVDGKTIGKTFSAAADLKKFQKSWTEPGIYVRTAANWDKEVVIKEWLDALDLSDKCKNEGRTKHSHTIYNLTYTGAYDVWSDCEKSGNAYAYLVAASDPPGQLVVIEFQALNDADVEAFKVLLKSFFVNGGDQTGDTTNSTSGNNGNKEEVDLSKYTTLNDDTGKLSVRVPKEWSDTSSGNWMLNDKKVGLSLSASTDLKAYNDNWNTPGMFLGVSTDLAKDTDAKTFLDTWDYSKDCKRDSRIDYDDSVYAGAYDIWKDCGGEKGNLFVVVSVMPKAKQDLLVLINVSIPAHTETQPFEQILATFDYNESGSAVSNNTESNNTEGDNTDTQTNTETDTTDTQSTNSSEASIEVVATTLNVRSGPGTNYEKIATVSKGQTFTVIGQINNCAWLKVQDSTNQEGWVSGDAQYVTLDTDCAEIPQAQAPAASSGNNSGNNTGNNSGSTSGNASKGCYNFQNNVGKELTITFTRSDGKWNKTFKVAKGGQHLECFDPGKYTYTLSAPGFESGNNELIINKGDNYNFPINVKN